MSSIDLATVNAAAEAPVAVSATATAQESTTSDKTITAPAAVDTTAASSVGRAAPETAEYYYSRVVLEEPGLTALLHRAVEHQNRLREAVALCAHRGEVIPPTLRRVIDDILSPAASASTTTPHGSNASLANLSVGVSAASSVAPIVSAQRADRSIVNGDMSTVSAMLAAASAAPRVEQLDPAYVTVGAQSPSRHGVSGGGADANASMLATSPGLRTLEAATQMLEAVRAGHAFPGKHQSHRHLLDAAFVARREGRSDDEVNYLRLALATTRQSLPLEMSSVFRLHRMIGDAFANVKKFTEAESSFYDWFLEAQRVGDAVEVKRALTSIGNIKMKQGDIAAAEHWLTQALAPAPLAAS